MATGAFCLRPEQLPPQDENWLTWMLLGGRGSGKTRAGAEWVQAMASGCMPAARNATGPIALVGETFADVREVMIDGPSGIRRVARFNRPSYEPTRRRLLWPNGMVAHVYSAHDPESLRGPQFSAAWSDELAKWPDARACWDMLQFGLRLGERPRQIVTTTPKPLSVLKEIMADPKSICVKMRTRDNAENLAPSFLAYMAERYAGSSLGRQELDGELIEERETALWSRGLLDACRVRTCGDMMRIVVAVDPPASSKSTSDLCGIVVAGIDKDGLAHVIADHSIGAAKPQIWAARAIAAYEAVGADVMVAEVNQGGDMVASVIHALDPSVNVKAVRAQRGKWLRAEPVAALYAQQRVKHVGLLRELEDEMCDFGPDGLSDGHSPDRLDACVWALSELLLVRQAKPRIRTIN